MKISEVIDRLNEMKNDWGDIEVAACGGDDSYGIQEGRVVGIRCKTIMLVDNNTWKQYPEMVAFIETEYDI